MVVEPKIIFEDGEILVLEKPAGMVVNRAESVKEETLQEWLEKKFEIESGGGIGNRAGIVHRLDKETSGLILVAKTLNSFENLQSQFKERIVKKRYLALVHGKVVPDEGEIIAPVGRLPWNRERFGVLPGGREAKTTYKIIRNLIIDNLQFSLLELSPQTGRTHQIRIHLKYLNHPVVGDEFYAGRKTSREDRKWCPRLFLHAAYLGFLHPTTQKWLEFTSELPEDLKGVIDKLKNG